MRRFGRQCRGQGKVFVRLVRQTETQLLTTGEPVVALAHTAQAQVQSAAELTADQRARWDTTLTLALVAHQQIVTQSRRLTHGKPLTRCKIVNAYDATIAPICKGKSNCPTQFGRKPGLLAEPATGFVFAARLPVGNPSDISYVLPLVDLVQTACTRVTTRTTPRHPLVGRGPGRKRPHLASKSAHPRHSHRRYPTHGRAPLAHAVAGSHPGGAHHRRLASQTHCPPSAAGLCGRLQPSGGGKYHRQLAESGRRTAALQRVARRRCATHDGRHGPQRGHGPPHPSRAPDDARPEIPPIASSQVA